MGIEKDRERVTLVVGSETMVRHYEDIDERSIVVFRSLAEMHRVPWRVFNFDALVPVPPKEAVPEPCFETGLGA